MIHGIEVTNYLGDTLEVDLRDPEKSGFLIYDITGLGPGKADIRTTTFANGDGSIFNSSRVNTRNIVISMEYMFSDSIEDARQRSYKYFPIKKPLLLKIKTDNRVSEIIGYVESNDPVIFSSRSITQISIICPNPYFYSSGNVQTTTFYGIEPMFEFPFSNESLNEKLLVMSEIQNKTESTIYYEGDVETGIKMHIKAIGLVKNISIYNVTTQEFFIIDTDSISNRTGKAFDEGDELIVSTVNGNKYIQLLRDGLFINVLYSVDRQSTWFQISKGDNLFAFTAEEGDANLQFRVENHLLYEGV